MPSVFFSSLSFSSDIVAMGTREHHTISLCFQCNSMFSYEIHSLFPRFSEMTFILTSVFLVDDEEEEVEEEEEEAEALIGAAVHNLRGAGVGGISAFFLAFLSVTVEISTEGTSEETSQPGRDAQTLRRGHLRACRQAERSPGTSSHSVAV